LKAVRDPVVIQVPTYYAQIDDGLVTDLRKTTRTRIEDYPDLYPGRWVRVPSMVQYPALGWLFDGERFVPPPEKTEEE
jgi:hypothetical protein